MVSLIPVVILHMMKDVQVKAKYTSTNVLIRYQNLPSSWSCFQFYICCQQFL